MQVQAIAKITTDAKENSSLEVSAATFGLWECGAKTQGCLPRALQSQSVRDSINFDSENNPVFCSRKTAPVGHKRPNASKGRVSQHELLHSKLCC